MKKSATATTRTSKTATAPARKKLALKKDALKDLSAGRAAKDVKAGAHTRFNGTCTCVDVG